MFNPPQVAILLATYNGDRHLREQLNSIVLQKGCRLEIFASDDGSTDTTLEILQSYPVEVLQGPRQGFAANFMHLIDKVDETSDYYAFSDQDDVWDPDKLQRSIECLSTVPADIPSLYCARTVLVDDQLTPYGYSPLFKKPPNFLNALVQNIGGGNTMVFNRAALNLLRQTKNKHTIIAHDWWTYLLISGAGGAVFYDSIPSLRYRQHQGNVIGSNVSWKSRFYRIRMLFQGRFKSWIDQNNKNLLDVAYLLKDEHRRQLEAFELSRRLSLVPRLFNMLRLGIYRQTTVGQIGLFLGATFNKF